MKKTVLLVFDKFKDTLSSSKVCIVVASALAREGVDIKSVPISDGGDGFVDCMHHILKGKGAVEKKEVEIQDPLGQEAKAAYLIDRLS